MRTLTRLAICSFMVVGLLGGLAPGAGAQLPKVHFLPHDGLGPITDLYKHASKTIHVAASVITAPDIAAVLVDARRRGVDVRVLLDETQVRNKYSLHPMLLDAGIDVRVLNSMTNEFGIIDFEKALYVGSGFLHTDIKSNPKLGNYLIFFDPEMARRYELIFTGLFKSKASKP